ncbi:MAG: Hsp20/alpha crystallin family protein [Thioalkalivibrio sp.]|nr:Hsp20/alpha crystallin family protein [Thioalkalivibrio sp.]
MNDQTDVARREESKAEAQAALMCPVDVFEDATGITLLADLPGVPKDALHLQVEAETLTIEGEVSLEVPEGMEATHAEVNLPRYRRVFTLSRELDTEQVRAEFRNGVLTLRIPRAEHAQPRRIDVEVV